MEVKISEGVIAYSKYYEELKDPSVKEVPCRGAVLEVEVEKKDVFPPFVFVRPYSVNQA